MGKTKKAAQKAAREKENENRPVEIDPESAKNIADLLDLIEAGAEELASEIRKALELTDDHRDALDMIETDMQAVRDLVDNFEPSDPDE